MPRSKKSTANPIPLLPEQLPQQNLYVVKTLAAKPQGFQFSVSNWPENVKERAGSSDWVCQLEWAYGPHHNWIRAWSIALSDCGRYCLLSSSNFNDESLFVQYDEDGEPLDDGVEPWDFKPCAWSSFHPELGLAEHAALLLAEDLRHGKLTWDEDQWHWVNEEGLLGVDELEAIAAEVWPGDAT